jgi:hypothetical protein
VPYMLDEAHGWSLSIEDLRSAAAAARAAGKAVRGLVFINPGAWAGESGGSAAGGAAGKAVRGLGSINPGARVGVGGVQGRAAARGRAPGAF